MFVMTRCSFGKTLLTFALPLFVLQGQFACKFGYLLTSYFCILNRDDDKNIIFVFVLEGVVGLHRTSQLQLLWNLWLDYCGMGLDYCDVEWFALEMNCILPSLRLHPSTAFWTLFVDEGHSISSKGFLPTVVDIIVI